MSAGLATSAVDAAIVAKLAELEPVRQKELAEALAPLGVSWPAVSTRMRRLAESGRVHQLYDRGPWATRPAESFWPEIPAGLLRIADAPSSTTGRHLIVWGSWKLCSISARHRAELLAGEAEPSQRLLDGPSLVAS